MRPLLLALCLLFAACTTLPERPPHADSERLYRALALHEIVRTLWLAGAERTQAGQLPANEAAGLSLLLYALLAQSNAALQADFPALLHKHAAIAQGQQEALATLAQRMAAHDLTTILAIERLSALDSGGKLESYRAFLLAHGYAPAEVEQMDKSLRAELHEILEAP